MDANRWTRFLPHLLVLGSGLITLHACVKPGPVPACPDHDGFAVLEHDSLRTINEVLLAGKTTLIPEFHDCQRLIAEGAHGRYGPLAAVWVSENLDRLVDSLRDYAAMPSANLVPPPNDTSSVSDSSNQPQAGGAGAGGSLGPVALPFAVIYVWDGRYTPLHLAQGWNCLYLVPAGQGFDARMVHVETDADCFAPVSTANLAGSPLAVQVVTATGMFPEDYPAVGRWDIDSVTHEQFIGLECGKAWCEVSGKKGAHRSPAYSLQAASARKDRRVFEVKGWYDEQVLAYSPSAGGALTPGQYLATVVPDPHLGEITDVAEFDGQWVPAGWITIRGVTPGYADKYGLRPGSMPVGGISEGLTHASLCRNSCDFGTETAPSCTPSSDGGTWYAKYEGAKTVYKCVERHAHPGVHIPGTARWSWSNTDEKLWFRCENGCCTSQ